MTINLTWAVAISDLEIVQCYIQTFYLYQNDVFCNYNYSKRFCFFVQYFSYLRI